MNKLEVGDCGHFETDSNMPCPNCGANMGYYLDRLGDTDETECDECGTVFSVQMDYVFYFTVKSQKKPEGDK